MGERERSLNAIYRAAPFRFTEEATAANEELDAGGRGSSDRWYGPVLMIGTMVFLFFVVIFLSGLMNRRSAGSALHLTCPSESCLEYREEVDKSISIISPCSDFYAHVCSEWDKLYVETPSEMDLRNKLYQLQQALTVEQVPDRGQTSFQKAARLYQSCLDVLVERGSELNQAIVALRSAGVVWPHRPAHPDLLVTTATLRLRLGIDGVMDLKMPDATTLTVVALPTGWLDSAKRLRYALDIQQGFEEYFTMLWTHFTNREPVTAERESLLYTEKHMFEILAAAHPFGSTRLTLEALASTCKMFPGSRWNTLLQAAFDSSPEHITAVELEHSEALNFVCELVNYVTEADLHYYIEWLAVQKMATTADSDIAQLTGSGTDFIVFTFPSTCFQTTMRLFGEPVLFEASRRWHQQIPMFHSEARRAVKDVWHTMSEVLGNSSGVFRALMRVMLRGDELYPEEREHLVESAYMAAPDMSGGFLRNRLALLNDSIYRDGVERLGFSWELLMNTMRQHQLPPDLLHVSHLMYRDMPPEYHYAVFGVAAARQLLALFGHARATPAGDLRWPKGFVEKLATSEDNLSLALDIALRALRSSHAYVASRASNDAQDFYRMACHELCSGRNSPDVRLNFIRSFTASSEFESAFSCHFKLNVSTP